jgi:hypothetical protein
MMQAVIADPEYRSTLENQVSAENEEVFDELRQLERAMRQTAMVSQRDAENPPCI